MSSYIPDPFAPLEVVLAESSCWDDALDPEMDVAKYLETYDPALIKELPGRRARRFRLGGITRPFLIDVVDSCSSDRQRWAAAAMAACHSFVDAAGQRHDAQTHQVKGDTQRVAGPKWITRLMDEVGAEGAYAVGRAARWKAGLPKPPPPPSG